MNCGGAYSYGNFDRPNYVAPVIKKDIKREYCRVVWWNLRDLKKATRIIWNGGFVGYRQFHVWNSSVDMVNCHAFLGSCPTLGKCNLFGYNCKR